MKCPHCSTGINLETDESPAWPAEDYKNTGRGYDLSYGHCPECAKLIVSIRRGKVDYGGELRGYEMQDNPEMEIIYPKFAARFVEPEVPERCRKDFLEASAVLALSPKASAALSRRLLQHILRDDSAYSIAISISKLTPFSN